MGVHALMTDKKLFLKGLLFTAVLLTTIGIHLFLLKDADHFQISLKASLFAFFVLAAFQTLLWLKDKNLLKSKALHCTIVLLIFAELFLYVHRERPRRFDSFGKVPYMEFLKSQPEPVRSYGNFWAFYPNTATGFEVDDLGYFLGLVPARYVKFVNALIKPGHFHNDLRPPSLRAIPIENKKQTILDLLNVRYLIIPSQEQLGKLVSNSHLLYAQETPVYNNEVRIYERRSALPRAYIVHRAVFETDEAKTFRLIELLGPGIREGVVVSHPRVNRILEELNEVPIKDDSTVKITRMTVNEVQLEVQMKNPGFVVLSDAYHPDWRASINGISTKVFQTNYLVRSVYAPKGEHTIKFVFAPFSYYFGLAVSLVSLIVLFFLFRKRNSQSS